MEAWIEVAFNIGVPLVLLVLGFFIGTRREQRHLKSIRAREEEFKTLPAVTLETPPPGWDIGSTELVSGNVVISLDYFKRFLAGLRAFVGGRIKSYESLLDRARREAVLRLKEQAKSAGCVAIINVRLETSRMASSRNGNGTAGIEVLAFGTGLRLHNAPSDL